jgi:hypothetical protein
MGKHFSNGHALSLLISNFALEYTKSKGTGAE